MSHQNSPKINGENFNVAKAGRMVITKALTKRPKMAMILFVKKNINADQLYLPIHLAFLIFGLGLVCVNPKYKTKWGRLIYFNM